MLRMSGDNLLAPTCHNGLQRDQLCHHNSIRSRSQPLFWLWFVVQASAEIVSKVGQFRALPLRLLGAVIRFSYHIGCCVTLKTDAARKLLTSQEKMYCALFDNASVRHLFSFAHITWYFWWRPIIQRKKLLPAAVVSWPYKRIYSLVFHVIGISVGY